MQIITPFRWKSSRIAVLLAAQLVSVAAFAQAAHLLDVDFSADSYHKVGPAAIGQTTTDYWNIYSRDIGSPSVWRDSGQLTGLKWADGSSSPMVLSVTNAAGAWGNGSTDPMF